MVDISKIRGFNYQPSYGSTSYENWIYYKPEIVELELRRGKFYFPKMNDGDHYNQKDTNLGL